MPPASAAQKTASAAMPIAMLRAWRFRAALLLRMRRGAVGVERQDGRRPRSAIRGFQPLRVRRERGFDGGAQALALREKLSDLALLVIERRTIVVRAEIRDDSLESAGRVSKYGRAPPHAPFVSLNML